MIYANKRLFNGRILLYLTCFILGLFVFLRDIYSIQINKAVIIVFSIVSMVFMKKNHLIAFLGFAFSLTYGLPGTYIYLAASIILLFKDYKRFKFKVAYLFWLLFSLVELILSLTSSSVFSFSFYISFISRLFLLFYFLSEINFDNRSESGDYSTAIKLYIAGTIIFLLISLLLYLKNGSLDLIITGKIRFGDAKNYYWVEEETEGLLTTTNANNIAYQSCVSLACCILLFFRKRKKIWLAVYLVIWVFALLTSSQTFLVVSLLQILIWIILLIIKKEKVALVLFATIALVGIAVISSTGILGLLITRIENGLLNRNDSGRFQIFVLYFTELSSRPFRFMFGTGALYYRDALNLDVSCHNALEQIFVSYGLIGFILFVYISSVSILKIGSLHNRGKVNSFIAMLPLISALIFTQTIQFFNPVELMLPFIVGLFSIRVCLGEKLGFVPNKVQKHIGYQTVPNIE